MTRRSSTNLLFCSRPMDRRQSRTHRRRWQHAPRHPRPCRGPATYGQRRPPGGRSPRTERPPGGHGAPDSASAGDGWWRSECWNGRERSPVPIAAPAAAGERDSVRDCVASQGQAGRLPHHGRGRYARRGRPRGRSQRGQRVPDRRDAVSATSVARGGSESRPRAVAQHAVDVRHPQLPHGPRHRRADRIGHAGVGLGARRSNRHPTRSSKR